MSESLFRCAVLYMLTIGFGIVMVFGIHAVTHRLPMVEPIVGSGSMVVAAAFVCFAVNVWRNASNTSEAA